MSDQVFGSNNLEAHRKELEMLLDVKRKPKTGEEVCKRDLYRWSRTDCGYKREEVAMC